MGTKRGAGLKEAGLAPPGEMDIGRRKSRRLASITDAGPAPLVPQKSLLAAHAPGSAQGESKCSQDDHMTEYERERAAQIARNKQRMAELELHELAAALNGPPHNARQPHNHHQRPEEKGAANKKARQAEREARAALPRRTSLRQKGVKAEGLHALGVQDELPGGQIILNSDGASIIDHVPAVKARHPSGCLPFRSSLGQDGPDATDAAFLQHLRRTAAAAGAGAAQPGKPTALHNVAKLRLQDRHVAKVTRNGTTYMDFRPCGDQLIIAAGDKEGNIALWDVDYTELEGARKDFDGVMPIPDVHRQYISCLRWAGPSNLVSCSYDGSIRMLDITRAATSSFVDLTSNLDEDLEISAMDVQTNRQETGGDSGCCSVAYVGDKNGDLQVVDLRAGCVVSGKPLPLHNRKINVLHLEPTGAPLLLSSSTDASIKIWDVRKLAAKSSGHVQAVSTLQHLQSCHGAQWAPDGSKRILSTSFDDTVKIWAPLNVTAPTPSTNPTPANVPVSPAGRATAAKAGLKGRNSKGLLQGTISKFFGSAATRAAGVAAAAEEQRKPGGRAAAASAAAAAAAAGQEEAQQWPADIKGSWLEALRVPHNNQTGRYITPFKAVWGPACDIFCVANMQRGVDVFDVASGSKLAVLCREEAMTAIPSRIAMHPTRNVLAAATASGRVHVWQ